MKDVWFIRHAESIANAGFTSPDPVSIELTELGHQQAKELTKSITIIPELFIVSPFLRTKQTAVPALAKYPDVPVEEWAVQEFSYLSPIVWANTSSQDRAPRADWYWENCDPDYNDGGGAESFNNFIERVDDTLIKLSCRPEKFIVMFSHGQFLKALWFIMTTSKNLEKIPSAKEKMKRIDSFIKAINLPNTGILKMNNSDFSFDFSGCI